MAARRYWQIKSRKQHIRLWFEFLKLAHLDPALQDNLKKSAEFYAPWGDVTTTLFDPWWAQHKQLFGDDRVMEVNKVSQHPNLMTIQVPLNVAVSTTIKEVKRLIEERQGQKLRELGIDPSDRKSKVVGFSKYELNAGPEFSGKTYNGILLKYRYWVELGRPKPFNDNVIDALRAKFDARANNKTSDRPGFTLQDKDVPDKKKNLRYDDDVVRQYRRYLSVGIRVVSSTSLGRFPQ
jgi:hypothetical protein